MASKEIFGEESSSSSSEESSSEEEAQEQVVIVCEWCLVRFIWSLSCRVKTKESLLPPAIAEVQCVVVVCVISVQLCVVVLQKTVEEVTKMRRSKVKAWRLKVKTSQCLPQNQ